MRTHWQQLMTKAHTRSNTTLRGHATHLVCLNVQTEGDSRPKRGLGCKVKGRFRVPIQLQLRGNFIAVILLRAAKAAGVHTYSAAPGHTRLHVLEVQVSCEVGRSRTSTRAVADVQNVFAPIL